MKPMNILIVGGAGYIGAQMCKDLSKAGYQPIVLDNLSGGHQGAVRWGPLIHGSMSDGVLLKKVFSITQFNDEDRTTPYLLSMQLVFRI